MKQASTVLQPPSQSSLTSDSHGKQARARRYSSAVVRELLESTYPSCMKLKQHLNLICPGTILILDGDTSDYVGLLLNTYVTSTLPTASLSSRTLHSATRRHRTQHDVIMHVIQELFKRHERPDNVLCYGYRRRNIRDESSSGVVAGISGITSFFPNTIVNELKNRSWITLLDRIGEAAMNDLLLNRSVFTQEPVTRNYIQLAGVLFANLVLPGTKLAPHALRKPSLPTKPGDPTVSTQSNHRKVPKSNSANKASCFVSKRAAIRHISKIFHVKASSARCWRLPKRYVTFVPLIRELLTRQSRCNVRTILRQACKYDRSCSNGRKRKHISESCGSMTRSEDMFEESQTPRLNTYQQHKKRKRDKSLNYRDLVSQYSEYSEVSRFVQLYLGYVIPDKMWGCAFNRHLIFNSIDRYLRRKKYERFSPDQMIPGLKTTSLMWLHSGSVYKNVSTDEHVRRVNLMTKWVHWLFNDLIVPLIRQHFHATETGLHKNRIFYFRKSLWQKMQSVAMRELTASMYTQINKSSASRILSESKLGFSYLRLVPKLNGMRAIVNMSRRQVAEEENQWGLSINQKLKNLFHVLGFERDRKPELLGASVFGLDDVFTQYKQFAVKIRGSASNVEHPNWPRSKNLFFVSVDVKRCFDSVKHDKLFEIMSKVLKEDEYIVRRFSTVIANQGKLYRKYNRDIGPADSELTQFSDFVKEAGNRFRNAILSDQTVCNFEGREDLLELLKEHIYCNLISIGGELHRQVRGIAQGSVLSALLCSFFYGDFENTVLNSFKARDDYLMMRLIDDFLVVTTDQSSAIQFLRTMHKGVESYGCNINTSKTKTNFKPTRGLSGHVPCDQVLVGSKAAPSTKSTSSTTVTNCAISGATRSAESSTIKEAAEPYMDAWMPWCGMLLNTTTLETRSDLSRYQGSFVADTITADLAEHPGQSLREKLLFFLKMRFHPLMIDEDINTLFGIGVNVYQVFRLCAIKFCCHVKLLPPNRRTRENVQFFLSVTEDLLNFPHQRIQFTKREQNASTKSLRLRCSLSGKDFTYIGLAAFVDALNCKQTVHLPLLSILRERKSSVTKVLSGSRLSLWQRVISAPATYNPFSTILY